MLRVSYCDSAVSVVCHKSLTFYLVYALEATIFCPMIMKLGKNVCLEEKIDKMENRLCLAKNQVTRSKKNKKHCVCSTGNIFSPIMKLGQNVCVDAISDNSEVIMSGCKVGH